MQAFNDQDFRISACFQFKYKGYEISATTLTRCYCAVYPLDDDTANPLHMCKTVEEAIDFVNSIS